MYLFQAGYPGNTLPDTNFESNPLRCPCKKKYLGINRQLTRGRQAPKRKSENMQYKYARIDRRSLIYINPAKTTIQTIFILSIKEKVSTKS